MVWPRYLLWPRWPHVVEAMFLRAAPNARKFFRCLPEAHLIHAAFILGILEPDGTVLPETGRELVRGAGLSDLQIILDQNRSWRIQVNQGPSVAFSLRPINVLVGANGAGKSNLI